MHLIAALQMNTGSDKDQNLDVASSLVREAAQAGASLIGLPETFNWMGPEDEREAALEPLDGPTGSRMASLARELGIHLLAGSILEAGAPDGRAYNTSILYGPGGERLAVYRKLHLFDVEIGDGATYRESRNVAPGDALAVADTPPGKLGLTVCYDLRFPELYRALSEQGAELLAVPAAFTLMTGKDHWEVLLRARAIENLCWVMAPAQVGAHSGRRQTYGNAMVIDPWGTVVARASDGPGFALGRIDPALQARVRERLPSLSHRRSPLVSGR